MSAAKSMSVLPRYRRGALLCSAKGNTCKANAVKGQAVCRNHGGESTGRPIIHGRHARYARIFGEGFSALLRDPELLKSDAEIALFDQYTTERAAAIKDGFSGPWLKRIKHVGGELQKALAVGDAPAMRGHTSDLLALIEEGADQQAAWEDLLGAAKQRAELAVKVDANVAKREAGLAEAAVLGHLVKMLEIFRDVAGDAAADKARREFEVKVLGRVGQSDGDGMARPAPGGVAVH